MFERLRRLYESGQLSKDGLKNAVVKGLITEDEYQQISGEKFR